MNMELMEKLTQTCGVSGNEEEVSLIVKNEIMNYADEITSDCMGNLVALKKSAKGSDKKLMLCAHIDEIGIIVTFIQPEGFLRFGGLGGLNLKIAEGQRVSFKNGTTGVVCVEEKADRTKALKVSDMYIDIGASSEEEALKLVDIGDVACFCGEFYSGGNRIISKALDDRIGVYCLIEAFKNIKNPAINVYAVFTTQEEIGLRGAKTASYSIEPDYALAIDVTDTGDTPNCNPMAVKLGDGVCIKLKDNSVMTHKKINTMLKAVAESENIDVQYEILTFGGTDAGAVHTQKGGTVTGALSIPTRNIHSPSEMVDLNDVKGCVSLITAFCESEFNW